MLGALAAGTLVLAGIAGLTAESGRRAGAGRELRPVDCWFEAPDDFSATCHRLAVPESRSGGSAFMLEIPVVILSVPGKRQREDAIVHLAGGPGDGAWIDDQRIDFWWDFIRENTWLNQRDLILLDQRGTGNVTPRMDCPELELLTLAFLSPDMNNAIAFRLLREAAGACHARVIAEGHDPASYTTRESALDLHDLHDALGAEKWNVYGLSYGTRLALAYLRHYPQDFRSVILDSADPPQIDFHGDDAWRTERAFEILFEACARDAACRSWYPNLKARLIALVHRYNTKILNFETEGPSQTETATVRLSGDLILAYLFLHLYNRDDIERVPRIIDIFDRGQAGDVADEFGRLIELWIEREDWGEGLALTIDCAEEYPYADAAQVLASYRAYPLLQSLAYRLPPFVACASWPVPGADSSGKELVRSAVPALVLAGSFDPITPPAYGRQTATGLANSHFLEFSNVGHDVLGNEPCAGRLAAIFLDDPKRAPNDPCLLSLRPPQFQPPVE